jgi:hypothetical protein
MLFGHKSPIKNHLSSKHQTHTHHVVMKPGQERPDEMEERMESSTNLERNPESSQERREPTPIRP